MGSMLYVVDACSPIISRPVVFKLKSTNGVCDTLDGIGDRVGEIIHRVDAPLVSCPWMLCVFYSIEGRVSHIDVGGCHIDLCSESVLSLREFTVLHSQKEIHVLFDGSIPIRGILSRLCKCSSVFLHLFRRKRVYICLTFTDEIKSDFIKLIVVIRSIILMFAPVETQPVDIVLYGIDIFHIFLGGVCVIKPKVTDAFILLCQAEVKANALDVSNVEIAVRLRRKACDNCVVWNSAFP